MNGVWQDVWYDTGATNGHFQAQRIGSSATGSRRWIARPFGEGGFEPKRAAIISMCPCLPLGAPHAESSASSRSSKTSSRFPCRPLMLANGWNSRERTVRARTAAPRSPLRPRAALEVYLRGRPGLFRRVTVPVPLDKREHDRLERVRRNHPHVQTRLRSSDGARRADFCRKICVPKSTRSMRVSTTRSTTGSTGGLQPARRPLRKRRRPFSMLDELENRLASKRYLTGDRLTEAIGGSSRHSSVFDPV